MSDERLRALERRFQATGDPEDERSFLLARVRAGEALDWEPFARLAALDPEAARALLAERDDLSGDLRALVTHACDATSDPQAWLRALDMLPGPSHLPRGPFLRHVMNAEAHAWAGLALARAVAARSAALHPFVLAAIEAAAEYLTGPRTAERLELTGQAARAAYETPGLHQDAEVALLAVTATTRQLILAIALVRRLTGQGLKEAKLQVDREGPLGAAVRLAPNSPAELGAAMRDAVGRWAYGG